MAQTQACSGETVAKLAARKRVGLMKCAPNTTHMPDESDRSFETARISETVEELAPDGAHVRPLLSLARGGMARFELQTDQISQAVMHRSVEEIWLVLSGRGKLWRRKDDRETVEPLEAGVCVSIPVATAFQFRCMGDAPLRIAAVTMPPWPGNDEAVQVAGNWNQPEVGGKP